VAALTMWWGSLLSAVVNLNHPTTYVQKGWFSISVPNLTVIVVMVVVFVLALLVPFPKAKES
jgi:hypothetical protein